MVDDVASVVDVTTGTWQGVIGTAGDTDSFTFTTTGGDVSLTARPAAMSANLDIEVRLFDDLGSLLTVVDPPSDVSDGNDLTSGLDAHLDGHLAEGTYTVALDGVGFGDPASTGYSGYGSVGRYTLTVAIENNGYKGGGDDGGTTDPEPTAPPAPSGFGVIGGTDGTATLSWTDESTNEDGFEIQREFRHRSGSYRGTTTWTVGKDTSSYVDSPGSGTFRYRIRAFNSVGYSTDAASTSSDGWVVVTVSGGGGGGGGKPAKTR